MTSNQISASDFVTIDQAQQIVRAHLPGHDQSIVKSISQIENKGYRQVSIWISLKDHKCLNLQLVIPLDIGSIFWI